MRRSDPKRHTAYRQSAATTTVVTMAIVHVVATSRIQPHTTPNASALNHHEIGAVSRSLYVVTFPACLIRVEPGDAGRVVAMTEVSVTRLDDGRTAARRTHTPAMPAPTW